MDIVTIAGLRAEIQPDTSRLRSKFFPFNLDIWWRVSLCLPLRATCNKNDELNYNVSVTIPLYTCVPGTLSVNSLPEGLPEGVHLFVVW